MGRDWQVHGCQGWTSGQKNTNLSLEQGPGMQSKVELSFRRWAHTGQELPADRDEGVGHGPAVAHKGKARYVPGDGRRATSYLSPTPLVIRNVKRAPGSCAVGPLFSHISCSCGHVGCIFKRHEMEEEAKEVTSLLCLLPH